MADYGNMRKKLLMVTSIAGSLLTISVSFFTSPSLYWMIGILIVLTNVLYGSSIVFYNAFLPLLVKSHPEFTEAASDKKLEVNITFYFLGTFDAKKFSRNKLSLQRIQFIFSLKHISKNGNLSYILWFKLPQ
jgi:MFS-type transporter involved in bile tolerance (Atg22 family)